MRTAWRAELNNKSEEFRRRLKESNCIKEYISKEDSRVDSPFELVERILLDFDFIAIPFCKGLKAVTTTALMYKPVLERTAPKILPFIAIQHNLREKSYKKHYLYLLKELKIDTQKLEVPTAEEIRREFT